MPFTCEACGRHRRRGPGPFPDPLPAVGRVLRCPECAAERPFVRPPLLVVTGAAGIGKSTLCARIAGTIPGAILLDSDAIAEDLASIASANRDYPAFWRPFMRLAHELAQNDVVVVLFGVMLPEQILANGDMLGYFESVRFLCLTGSPEAVHERRARREGTTDPRAQRWVEFNDTLHAAARELDTATTIDADRPADEIETDVRRWIVTHLHRQVALPDA